MKMMRPEPGGAHLFSVLHSIFEFKTLTETIKAGSSAALLPAFLSIKRPGV
jgi:hypothetical protein